MLFLRSHPSLSPHLSGLPDHDSNSPRNRRALVYKLFHTDKANGVQAAAAHAQLALVSDAEFESRKGLTWDQINEMLSRYMDRYRRFAFDFMYIYTCSFECLIDGLINCLNANTLTPPLPPPVPHSLLLPLTHLIYCIG